MVDTLREDRRFASIQAMETLLRDWHIEGLSVRPCHRMVGHTGFLTLARKGEAP
jgi:tRNA (adenine57-N1/adenine58-N1)-methyltransferase